MRAYYPANFYVLIAALILTIIGGSLIWYTTSWGPWAYSDSVSYLEASQNLAAGRGLVEIRPDGRMIPFTKQPPFYPFLLAFATTLGADTVSAARWVDIILFATCIFSLVYATGILTKKSWLFLLLPLIFITSPVMLENFTGLMSEAVFLSFGFAGLILLIIYFQNSRIVYLVASAVLIGLAALTRYAGSVIIVVAFISFLLFDKSPLKQRLYRLALFCLISAAPLILWMCYSFFPSNSTGRSPFMISNPWTALMPFRKALVNNLWKFIPYSEYIPLQASSLSQWRVKTLVLIFAFSLVLVLIGYAFWKHRKIVVARSTSPEFQLVVISFLYCVLHLIFIAFVSLFGPWNVDIDSRQLAPFYFYAVLCIFLLIGLFANRPIESKSASLIQMIFAVIIISSALPVSFGFLTELHQNGRGYTGRSWNDTALMQSVGLIPSDRAIISNDIEAIMFHTGRPAYRLPELQNNVASPVDEQFGSRTDDPVHTLFSQNCAALVIFNASNGRFDKLYMDLADARLQALVQGLYKAISTADGAIYYKASTCP
jgi:4-amino-4-deoxy-L-arabinose transferase-like glycosyltransferase